VYSKSECEPEHAGKLENMNWGRPRKETGGVSQGTEKNGDRRGKKSHTPSGRKGHCVPGIIEPRKEYKTTDG